MKSGLFDINGREIQLGDKYINPDFPKDGPFEVFFKSGCFCGGVTESQSEPLAWEYDSKSRSLIHFETGYIKIIS